MYRQWTNTKGFWGILKKIDIMENDSLIETNRKSMSRKTILWKTVPCKLHKNCQQINFYGQEKFIFFQLST